MKSKALGRGLDALLGEVSEAYENEGTQKESVIEIKLSEIKPNPYQPRKTFNDESLQELADSIKEDGLIQPIVVVEEIDGYMLIAGERRFRASKLAKLRTIKAVILNKNDESMRKLALLENIQRENLNAIELANAYNELINHQNITQEELASTIHKSRTHITNTLRLLQLSQKTQKALLDKKISAGHAKVLVGLNEKEQQLIVNSIIGQKLSVREVEKIIKDMKTPKKEVLKKEAVISYNFSELQSKFNDLGFKSKVSNNKLVIEFEDESQVENMLNWFD